MLVFLDFDGVLRPDTAPAMAFEEACLAQFEAVVREFRDARIVISSSWRLHMSLLYIRHRFSADVAVRVIGQTPAMYADAEYVRYHEITAFLRKFGGTQPTRPEPSKHPMLDWVAIDDDAEHFPEAILRTRVVLSDSTKGFRAQAASQLWRMLSARAARLRNAARKTP